MLTDQEKNELMMYKKRHYAFWGMVALTLFLYGLFFYFYISEPYKNIFLLIHIIVISILVILELILLKNKERAFALCISLFNGMFILGLYPLICFSIIYFNKLFPAFENLLLGFLYICFFIIAQKIEINLWKNRILFMTKNKLINFENQIYDYFKERDLYKGKFTVWHGYSLFMLIMGVSFLIVRNYSEINWISYKGLFACILAVIFGSLGLLYYSRLLTRGFLFLKLEKEKKTKIYTNLMKYIRMEDEINEWRKGKGLKPVKIKSFFFNGDIEK